MPRRDTPVIDSSRLRTHIDAMAEQAMDVTPDASADRHAYIVGSGIGGLSAAFFLIRDGHMPAGNITILESQKVEGGALDGAGNAEEGYIVRGGREMEMTFQNFWDVFSEIPALELPKPFTVLDEYRIVNDADKNWSKARLLEKQCQIGDFSTMGLSWL